MLAGYVLGRLCEGYFIRRFGFSIFVWRRFDSLSRLITARRNPNMILLGLGWLAGRPDIGLLAVVLWTLASTTVLILTIAAAEVAKALDCPVVSWLNPAPYRGGPSQQPEQPTPSDRTEGTRVVKGKRVAGQ